MKRGFCMILIPFKTKLKRKLLPIIESAVDALYPKIRKIREQKFIEFHEKCNKLSPKLYRSVKSLYDGTLDYDIYCVGSDQVWNYTNGYSILPFLLDFVPENKKKIAFASSIGLSSISKEAKDIFKKYLSKFDFIAVRETQAYDLLNNLLEQKIDVVLDPTLLLCKEDWQHIAKYEMCPKEKYLLLYIVTIKPCQYAIKLAEKIATERGLKIVRLFRSAASYDAKPSMINLPDAGPSDFVGLIEKADFVVTNSFHGTVFSVNFQIPFYTIIKPQKDNNSRLYSILNKLKMTNRLITIGDKIPSSDMWNCDFDEPTLALEAERTNSLIILSYYIQ